jgi:hypothetical protein
MMRWWRAPGRRGSRHAADRHKFAGEPAGAENGEPLFRLLVHGGVHPHDGSSWTPAVAEAIYTLAREPQVVAIGECGLDFNRNFPRRRSRRRRSAPSWRWPLSCRCRCFYTAATPTTGFWRCLNPGSGRSRARCCTALPAAAARCRNAWIWGCLSVLPVGYAMSGGAGAARAAAGDPGGTSAAGDRCALSAAARPQAETGLAA